MTIYNSCLLYTSPEPTRPEPISYAVFCLKKKGHRPITKVKNPEPKIDDPDWIIWAAWADRITFEEIEKRTGKRESDVIKIMRRSLKPSSFRLWRKRVNQKSIKHRKKFEYSRKEITSKIKKGDYL